MWFAASSRSHRNDNSIGECFSFIRNFVMKVWLKFWWNFSVGLALRKRSIKAKSVLIQEKSFLLSLANKWINLKLR